MRSLSQPYSCGEKGAFTNAQTRHHGQVNVAANLIRRLRSTLIAPFDADSFREGVRMIAVPAIAVAIWGFVTGVAMVNRGLSVPAAIVMTLFAYAGSAQLAALPLMAAGAPLPVVWMTALLVNLRFVIFSAAMRSHFAGLSLPQRLIGGYANGDLSFGLFSRRNLDGVERTPEQHRGFFYGTASVNYCAWMSSSMVGIFAGDLAPTDWGLELAALLALAAVVIPMLTRFPVIVGVIVAAIASILTAGWPMRLGVVASVVVGVAASVFVDARHGGEAVSQLPADQAPLTEPQQQACR